MSAAILLALQVTWIRTFSLLFGSSTYAVAAVIASSLAGLAIGGWFARFILRRGFLGIRFTIAAVFSLAALLLGVGNFAFECLPWWLTQLELCLSTHLPPVASYLIARGTLIFAFTIPQASTLGMLTPFLLGYMIQERYARLKTERPGAAMIAGRMMFASTAGSIFGIVAAGCLLIPGIIPLNHVPGFSHVSNIQNTYTLLSLVQLVIAAGALYSIERTMAKKQDGDAKNELPFSKDKRGALLAMLTTTSATALVVAVIHPVLEHYGNVQRGNFTPNCITQDIYARTNQQSTWGERNAPGILQRG